MTIYKYQTLTVEPLEKLVYEVKWSFTIKSVLVKLSRIGHIRHINILT